MERKTKVLLIMIAVVAGVALVVQAFLRARDTSQRNACFNNLMILTAPMMCCVPMAYRLTDGDKLDPKVVVEGYVKGGTLPVCPAGGTYQITWIVGGSNPTCSVHGDLIWKTMGVKTLKELDEMNHESEKAQPTSAGESSTRDAGLGSPKK